MKKDAVALTMFNFKFRVNSSNLSIQCQYLESHFRYGVLQVRGRLLNL